MTFVIQIARALIALALMGSVHEAHAQTKKDILGFYPGMDKTEFDKQLVTVSKGDCTPFWNSGGCSLKLGKLTFNFNKDNLLRDISYKFFSGTDPEVIISQITTEYSIKPISQNHRDAIARARTGYTTVIGSSSYVVMGGQIAQWELANKDVLKLDFIRETDGNSKVNNQYTLVLLGRKLIDAEKALREKERADKERELRNVNPKPKF